MIEIPKNRILKPSGVSDLIGDVVETFNLDLSSNYGAIRTTRTKLVVSSATEKASALQSANQAAFPATGSSSAVYLALDTGNYFQWNGSSYEPFDGIEVPFSFSNYRGDYYFVTNDVVYKGGDVMNDAFIKEVGTNRPSGETSHSVSDSIVFNDKLYVSGSNEIMTKSGTSWSTPISSDVASNTPHLLEVYTNRMYYTNDFVKVFSINTSNVVSTTSFALDLGLDDSEWTITMLKASSDRLWVGLLNTITGKGRVYQWDGETQNKATSYYDLESGVMAGAIFNNIPYVLDANGKLLAYAGGSFKEVERVFKRSDVTFDGADSQTNIRFIHPNGMTVTDYGTILIFFSNEITVLNTENKEETVPSGVYEYDPNIGLYHKYSLSYSPVATTTVTDYGQPNLATAFSGAIMYHKSSNKALTDNGNVLMGARYHTSDDFAESEYGVFIDDTLDTTQKWGYFVTTKQLSSSVVDKWTSIYSVYNEFINSTDKIVLKYKTKDDEPTNADITWTFGTTFTTTDNISAYVAGDEVQVVQGAGGGKSAHIVSVVLSSGTYTVTLDDSFTGVTGNAKVRLEKWIKLGEADASNAETQFKSMTIGNRNVAPWIKFKVCMQFTGKNELYKLRIINSAEV